MVVVRRALPPTFTVPPGPEETVSKPSVTVCDGVLQRIPGFGLGCAWLNEWGRSSNKGRQSSSQKQKEQLKRRKTETGDMEMKMISSVVYLPSDLIWLKSKYLLMSLKEGNKAYSILMMDLRNTEIHSAHFHVWKPATFYFIKALKVKSKLKYLYFRIHGKVILSRWVSKTSRF